MMSHVNLDHLRHWSPQSETHAPVDVLVQYLSLGWQPQPVVIVETFHYASRVQIYHFVLTNGVEQIRLPVLGNPAVLRIIDQHHLVIQAESERQSDHTAVDAPNRVYQD